MGYKVDKVVLNNKNGWKAFNSMRNSDGVKKELRDAGDTMGNVIASYSGLTRAHTIIKMDKNTYDRLVAEGKVVPRNPGEE